jgi:hypothetical protein
MPKQKILENQPENMSMKEETRENEKSDTRVYTHTDTHTHIKLEKSDCSSPQEKTVFEYGIEYAKINISKVIPALKWLYFISKVYIIWITIHYISCQLYVHYCVPSGITGYLLSPFLVSSPQCKALRWAFYTGGNIIDNMWNYLGVWASTQLLNIE